MLKRIQNRTDSGVVPSLSTKTPEDSMSISGIPSNSNAYSSSTNSRNAFRTDFGALANALNAGDLSGAQAAFSALQSLQPGRFAAATTPSTATNGAQSANAASPIGTDIGALAKALQSGDLSGAQAAFKKVQQDMSSAHRGHHHHHHKPVASPDSTTSSSATSSIDPNDPFAGGNLGLIA